MAILNGQWRKSNNLACERNVMSELKDVIDGEWALLTEFLKKEVSKERNSIYWIGPRERHVADPSDFDHARMMEELGKRFFHIHRDAICFAINSAIYKYHLR